jgi:serine/threonine protein kinase
VTEKRQCPKCGAEVSPDAAQGLCPKCLLDAGLESQVACAFGEAATGPFVTPNHLAATVLPDSLNANVEAPSVGSRLRYFGDYELLEEIARGGMGVVWRARQISLKRDVAVKMIRAGALAGPDEVARFLREAEAAANLQHPNIVAIHEVGECDGQHYFSMDYVAGRDLGALAKAGPLSPRMAARYVKVVAEAIHFAHQRGTLHRDLKPQNVLIDASDQPRVTDFGLAKFMADDSRLTQSGAVMGSPSYMSPEQADSRHADVGPASDVYSLGEVLYELVTGQPPFRRSSVMATLCAVIEAEPTAPRQLNADIPLDLETICQKCLEKSPLARYPTARALSEELNRFLEGEPIQARPASAVRKVVSWTRQHPLFLAALATLVAVSLAFSVFYLSEENAFLRAQQADPTLARTLGPRHQSLDNYWIPISSIAMCAGIYLSIFLRFRGVPVKDFLSPANYFRTIQPLDERARTFAVGAGLVLIACGVMLLVTAIQANVWEGEPIARSLALAYCPIYCGVLALGIAIRDYRRTYYGPAKTSMRQLSLEEIEPIRRALLEDRDFKAAVQRYHETVPEAPMREAKQYVIRLFMTLRAEEPDKFVAPSLSWATLNGKAALICAFIESLLLGSLWFVMPPADPTSAVSQFSYSFLFGMGMIGGLRVKGWRKLLLLVPALAVMIACEAIVPRLVQSSGHSIGTYLRGIFFGALLMASAFNPRR